MALLELAGVGKRFDDGSTSRWVLRDASLSVAAGDTLALCGPSGSGKSTLLNLIAATVRPDAGSIRFRGVTGAAAAAAGNGAFDVGAASESQRVAFRRRHIGLVFQFFNLVETLTVEENVLLPLQLNRRQDRRADALARLDTLGVGDLGRRFPGTLSGGEQQRVAIARALAHGPELLLADEPTGNLDADNAERVIDLLWQAAEAAGSALVIATHDERIATRADAMLRL